MNIKRLINEFGEEFEKEVFPTLPQSEYGNLESMVLYCVLRKTKPRFLAELGTESNGRSSFIIQKALLKNGREFIHAMFDMAGVVEEAYKNLVKKDLDEGIWLLSGPIEHTIEVLDKVSGLDDRVDFLFIDADHSYDFGKWYIDRIVSKLKNGTIVHIHDLNTTDKLQRLSPDTSEEKALRDLKEDGKLPLKTLVSLDNICKLNENLKTWTRIQKKHPFIGDPFPTEFPFCCSAEYFEKISPGSSVDRARDF